LTHQSIGHDIKFSNKSIDEGFYLGRVIITGSLVLAGLHLALADLHLVTKCRGAEALLGGVGMEAESTQLVLDLVLGLVVAGGRGVAVGGVLLKVAEAVEEGVLVSLGLLEELLLDRLLIKTSLRLVLAGGVPTLVLVLVGVILVGGVLVLLGAVGDKVVGISTAVASFLRTTTTLAIQAVVVKTVRTG
jgi:hypothetical protein